MHHFVVQYEVCGADTKGALMGAHARHQQGKVTAGLADMEVNKCPVRWVINGLCRAHSGVVHCSEKDGL